MEEEFDNDRLHRALERLGGVESEVIRLKHFDGLTFSQIGAQLGIPANTAKTRYYRGVMRLRTFLED